jgi:FKBP-type peptidyl-prolyl cis-trans isomerase FklB
MLKSIALRNKSYISGLILKFDQELMVKLTITLIKQHPYRFEVKQNDKKMKIKFLFAGLLVIAMIMPTYGQKKKDKKKAEEAPGLKLETRLDTVSYCLGVYIGGGLSQNGFGELKSDKMMAGIAEMMAKKKPLFDETQANEIIGKFVMEQRKVKADKNLAEGKAFLEKNKTEQGVVTLPSGLQYKIIKNGDGPKPDSIAKVTVHYHGTLLSGKVFDSSVERGQPVQLSVNNVIEGWKEALRLMPVGSKWKLFIPSALAYGENPQAGGPIEPNMVLVFDVELISIDADQPQSESQVQPQIQMPQ